MMVKNHECIVNVLNKIGQSFKEKMPKKEIWRTYLRNRIIYYIYEGREPGWGAEPEGASLRPRQEGGKGEDQGRYLPAPAEQLKGKIKTRGE